MSRVQRTLRTDTTVYLSIIFVSIAVSRMLQSLWPLPPILKGQNAAVTFQLALLVLAFMAWLMLRSEKEDRSYLHPFLIVLSVCCMFHFILILSRGELWSYVFVVVPVTIVLVWLKPPSFRELVNATNVFCVALVVIAVLTQALVRLGLVQSRNYVEHRYFGLANLELFRWRWEGPFGGVNYSGPVGAFLLVYGLTRSGWLRAVLVVSGATFMLASESRGAYLAAAVGVLTWVLCRDQLLGWSWSSRARVAIASVAVLCMVSISLMLDPSLNGRLEIWGDYIRLWTSAPLLGVGQSQLDAALKSGSVIFSGETGHSLWVDELARAGFVGVALTLAVISVALVLAVKAQRRGMGTGLVMLLAFCAGGLSELLVSWLYLSVLLLPLFISGLLSATWLQSVRTDDKHELSCSA